MANLYINKGSLELVGLYFSYLQRIN